MRNYEQELTNRVAWVRSILDKSGAKGIVFNNSGGKDCALAAIICKKATDNIVGLALPAGVSRSYGEDLDDAKTLSDQFGIELRIIDIAHAQEAMIGSINKAVNLTDAARSNIAPRLRMTAGYAVAQSLGYLFAGSSNLSEYTMGYYTKWGDGGYDFNVIADLTVTEVYEFLRYLGAPERIIKKPPSAGLFEGQTDEAEMGITYASIDRFIATGETEPHDMEKIKRAMRISEHKKKLSPRYPDNI